MKNFAKNVKKNIFKGCDVEIGLTKFSKYFNQAKFKNITCDYFFQEIQKESKYDFFLPKHDNTKFSLKIPFLKP